MVMAVAADFRVTFSHSVGIRAGICSLPDAARLVNAVMVLESFNDFILSTYPMAMCIYYAFVFVSCFDFDSLTRGSASITEMGS